MRLRLFVLGQFGFQLTLTFGKLAGLPLGLLPTRALSRQHLRQKFRTILGGCPLSLQFHHVKTETVYLASGRVRYEIKDGDSLRPLDLAPGDRLHIPAGTVHRVTAIEDADIFEVSTPELDDVVRLEDRYGRAGS